MRKFQDIFSKFRRYERAKPPSPASAFSSNACRGRLQHFHASVIKDRGNKSN
jgi:hypothetical protein